MGLSLYIEENKICGWSYSGFYLFRQRLANLAGIGDLNEMRGFGGTRSWTEINDDLSILINHSDCDGVISGEDAKKLLARLKELEKDFPSFPDSSNIFEDFSHDKNALTLLIKSLEENPGKEIEFS